MPDAIADLLQQSKAAHQRYRDNCARHVSNGRGGTMPVEGNPTAARVALEEAAALRQQAHEADPTHSNTAWLQEPLHSELTAFYAQELAK